MSIFSKLKSKKDVRAVQNAAEPVKNTAEKSSVVALGQSISIKKPWITEKAADLSKMGKYIFVVPAGSGSRQVKTSVETLYGVNVTSVNVINIKPKKRRLGRNMGKIPGYRKAIVTLKKGQSLDILPH